MEEIEAKIAAFKAEDDIVIKRLKEIGVAKPIIAKFKKTTKQSLAIYRKNLAYLNNFTEEQINDAVIKIYGKNILDI